MKLKATISLPGEQFSLSHRLSLAQTVIVTNSPKLHIKVYQNVLKAYLRVGNFGPAEYFTQLSDRMTRTEDNIIGFDVTLSGVSVTARRAQQDFWDGLNKLHEIYSNVASEHLSRPLRAQVFTRMALDTPIAYLDRHGSTPLLENGPTFVDGSASLVAVSEDKVIMAEAEALLGDKRTLEGIISLRQQVGNPERSR